MARRTVSSDSQYVVEQIMLAIADYVPRAVYSRCERAIGMALDDVSNEQDEDLSYAQKLRRAELITSGKVPPYFGKKKDIYSDGFIPFRCIDRELSELSLVEENHPENWPGDSRPDPTLTTKKLDDDFDLFLEGGGSRITTPFSSSSSDTEEENNLNGVRRKLFTDDSDKDESLDDSSKNKLEKTIPPINTNNNLADISVSRDVQMQRISRELFEDTPENNKPPFSYFEDYPRQASPRPRSCATTPQVPSTVTPIREDLILSTHKLLQETITHLEEEKLYHNNVSSTNNSIPAKPILGVPESRDRYPSLLGGYTNTAATRRRVCASDFHDNPEDWGN